MTGRRLTGYMIFIAMLYLSAGCASRTGFTDADERPEVGEMVRSFLGASPGSADELMNAPSDFLFQTGGFTDPGELRDILLVIDVDQWNDLLAYYDQNPMNERYVQGDMYFRSGDSSWRVENAGLRLRGNTFSRVRPEQSRFHDPLNPQFNQAHYRIKIDYQQDRQFFGQESLILKRANGDPSYVRERLALSLMRDFGVETVQRSTHVRLYILISGDERISYHGVYQLMEAFEKELLMDRFGRNDDGDLWKCLWPSPLVEDSPRSKMGLEDPDSGISFPYDLKTNKDELERAAAEFSEFIGQLNTVNDEQFPAWARRHLELESLLRASALGIMIGSWDDYWLNQNNYYLYNDEENRWHFIPYDLDNSFGTSVMADPGTVDVFQPEGVEEGSRPLIQRVLQVPEFQRRYAELLYELIDGPDALYQPESLLDRSTSWIDAVLPFVENDTGDNVEISDRTADWSRYRHYRLGFGGDDGGVNFFQTRIESAREDLAREYPDLPGAD